MNSNPKIIKNKIKDSKERGKNLTGNLGEQKKKGQIEREGGREYCQRVSNGEDTGGCPCSASLGRGCQDQPLENFC